MTASRIADHPVGQVHLDRWSARSFTGETMPEADLLSMFEAARWSQSANNNQPWRFSYALRGEEGFEKYVGFLMEFNEMWAREAAAIVVVVSMTHMKQPDGAEPKPVATHSLDTGAAMQSFTLQATRLGYIAHPMGGIHADKIRESLDIDGKFYKVEAAIAVGKLGAVEKLPERYREREVKSSRKPLSETVFKGTFKG